MGSAIIKSILEILAHFLGARKPHTIGEDFLKEALNHLNTRDLAGSGGKLSRNVGGRNILLGLDMIMVSNSALELGSMYSTLWKTISLS